jgi:hypothetical protein
MPPAPKGQKKAIGWEAKNGSDDLRNDLVFFSTFEELTLPIKGPMEGAGVVKLYEASPTSCLYVALARNMMGRIPLMPCFLDGNTTPSIPHTYSKNKNSCFPAGCADAAAEDERRGSDAMRSTCGCGCLDMASLAWAA